MPEIIVLTETQKAHYDKLSGKTAEAFLAKSAVERDAEIAKALEADPIVFKGETTGIEVRKSQGEFARKLAEQNEQFAKTQAEQATELAKAKAERETEILKADATTHLAHLAKSLDVKVAVLKALKTIPDEKVRGEALEMLKGANAAMKEAGVVKGYNPGEDPQEVTPQKKWDDAVAKLAADKSISVAKATEQFSATEVGKQLYTEIQKAKRASA